MNVVAERRAKVKFPVDTLALFAFEDENKPLGSWPAIDIKLQGRFADAAKNENFKGKDKQVLVIYPPEGKPAKRVVVAGLGKRNRFDGEKLRRAAAATAGRVKSNGASIVDVALPVEEQLSLDPREQAQAAAEGFLLACYEFKKYRSKNDANGKLETVRLLVETEKHLDAAKDGARRAEIYCAATCLTRDLVNEPPSVCTPRHLASAAQALSKRGISVKIFDERQIPKMKFGGLHGVSLGSDEPPRFVHMTYKSSGAKRTVAIVGKGITFDSGGLCIKPADGMMHMKNDMAGAGAVIGIMHALSELKPKINVHGIFAATENMPGGKAYKMRDVLTARNGKTMEIVNTDAEGRLVLADGLSYASELKPDEIIDMATLTGACVVALGPEISGVFSPDPDLVSRLQNAARASGEKVWQLPIDEDYREMIKSDVADMKNSGGRWGGSITAALFLKEFVADGIPWAHIDIAGPALTESNQPYRPAGGTGVMVRTLLRYLESR